MQQSVIQNKKTSIAHSGRTVFILIIYNNF